MFPFFSFKNRASTTATESNIMNNHFWAGEEENLFSALSRVFFLSIEIKISILQVELKFLQKKTFDLRFWSTMWFAASHQTSVEVSIATGPRESARANIHKRWENILLFKSQRQRTREVICLRKQFTTNWAGARKSFLTFTISHWHKK